MIHGEPTLDEMLVDPIILKLVRSDGLTLDDVVRACEAARRALKRTQSN